MKHSLWWVAGLVLALGACKNVPDEQLVPVPADGSVLHGQYSGTLTEQMQLINARTSRDGSGVFALFASSGHTLLLDLDPATGAVRKRRAVAGYPEAFGLAPDGTRLIGAAPGDDLQDRYRRWDTKTGAEIPTIHTVWASRGLTQDLEWGGTDAGTLLNLSTGRQISVSGLPPACSASVESSIQPLQIGATADGFYLLENDATLYRLDSTGRVTGATRLESGCNTYSIRTSDMAVQDGALRLVFGSYGKENGPLQAKLLTWTSGQPPTTATLGNGSPLPGSAAGPGEPLFSAQHGDNEPERLSAGQRWNVPLTPVQLSVSGDFTASYASTSSYDLRGSLTVAGQTYRALGSGATSSTTTPRLVFTQALCAPNGQSLVPACPRLDWQLNLDLQGTSVGTLAGDGLLPSGSRRHSQSGRVTLTSFNEDGLNDGRAFLLSLQPN